MPLITQPLTLTAIHKPSCEHNWGQNRKTGFISRFETGLQVHI